jgi:hypothetical protein
MNCLLVPEPRQTGAITQEKRANKLAHYKKVLLDAPALLQKCGVTRRIKYYCSSLPVLNLLKGREHTLRKLIPINPAIAERGN